MASHIRQKEKTMKKSKTEQKLTITADQAMKRRAMKRIERQDVTDGERRLVQNMSKIEDLCEETADKIYEMRRKCFTIKEIAKAIGKRDRFVAAVIDYKLWRDVGFGQVKRLRKDGLSIKAIAKKLQIRDRIVSRVLNGKKKA
jgi:hypothetical protein